MTNFNPYAELDVPVDATDDEIKQAYRERARETHPDSSDKPDRDAFMRAGVASRLLLDHKKRRRYDRTGKADENEEIDNLEAGALGLIASFINSIMRQYVESNFDPKIDPRKSNIMESFRAQVLAGISGLEGDRLKAQKSLAFLRDMQKRFERGSKLEYMVRDQVQAQEAHIEEIEHARRLQTRAIQIAAKVRFRFDVPDEAERDYGIDFRQLPYYRP